MTLPAPSAASARDLVRRFTDTPVLVVGDIILDRFIVGHVTRISPEAPVPVVRYESEYVRLGGAANVAHNIVALGGRASLVGVVGADATADRLRAELARVGIEADGLVVDATRPTTEKVRVVTARRQQVARIDYEQDGDIGGGIEAAVCDRVRQCGGRARALLVSDYLKGVITRRVVEAMLEVRARGAALLVDPKVPHLGCYGGATLITPNHLEAESATHLRIRNDEEARVAARQLRDLAGCESALITRGEHGMWLSSRDTEGAIPAMAREVADVTGAGDTVVAVLALALAAGSPPADAAWLANHAASVAVGKFGTAAVSPAELLATF